VSYVTLEALLQGRDKQYPLTDAHRKNAEELLRRVNALLAEYVADGGDPNVRVSSGYRPGHYNVAAGGAKASAHLTCSAVDLADPGEKLAQWVWANRPLLNKYNLDLEDPNWTPGWVHLDLKHRSGTENRVFIPYARPTPRRKYQHTDALG
jgi:hypothetical protein